MHKVTTLENLGKAYGPPQNPPEPHITLEETLQRPLKPPLRSKFLAEPRRGLWPLAGDHLELLHSQLKRIIATPKASYRTEIAAMFAICDCDAHRRPQKSRDFRDKTNQCCIAI